MVDITQYPVAGPVYLVDPTTGLPYAASSSGGGAVTQPTASNLNAQVVGNSASGVADSGNPVKIGGRYNITLPTLTDGQRGDVQLTARGATYIAITSGNNPGAIVATLGVGRAQSTSNTFLATLAQQSVSNGTTLDAVYKPNIYKRVASSAAAGNPDFVKASAGEVMQFWGQNGAAITYLQIYNRASAPTIGTDTPILTYPIPANAAFAQTIPNGGAYFGTGIAFAFTTDAAGTTGSAAAAVLAFAMLAA